MLVDAPLARIPLFVRGGAVLPLGNERLSTSAPLTILTLGVYPAGDSAFTLIEDDGTTTAYQEGEMAETSIRVAERQDRLTVDVAARQGSFHPHPRTMVAHIHTGRPPTGITFDGQRYGDTSWDAEREVIEVRWEDDGASHRIECSSAE
jgi:alpha-glucosidase